MDKKIPKRNSSKKILTTQFHYIPHESCKIRKFYEFILVDTYSIEIHQYEDPNGQGILFSKDFFYKKNPFSSRWDQDLYQTTTLTQFFLQN